MLDLVSRPSEGKEKRSCDARSRPSGTRCTGGMRHGVWNERRSSGGIKQSRDARSNETASSFGLLSLPFPDSRNVQAMSQLWWMKEWTKARANERVTESRREITKQKTHSGLLHHCYIPLIWGDSGWPDSIAGPTRFFWCHVDNAHLDFDNPNLG